MADYVGAIDQGTTSTRFMIFDHAGTLSKVRMTRISAGTTSLGRCRGRRASDHDLPVPHRAGIPRRATTGRPHDSRAAPGADAAEQRSVLDGGRRTAQCQPRASADRPQRDAIHSRRSPEHLRHHRGRHGGRRPPWRRRRPSHGRRRHHRGRFQRPLHLQVPGGVRPRRRPATDGASELRSARSGGRLRPGPRCRPRSSGSPGAARRPTRR